MDLKILLKTVFVVLKPYRSNILHMKKFLIIFIILVAVGAALFFGKSSLFTGNLNNDGVFKESPSKDKVVEGAFITYQKLRLC